MKLWWLKLYTLPDLRDQFAIAGLYCAIHFGVLVFFPAYYVFSFFALFGAIFIPSLPRKNGLVGQLDFHMMTLPKSELRNAFIADTLIHAFFRIGLSSVCVAVFAIFQPEDSFFVENKDLFEFPLMSTIIQFSTAIAFMIFFSRFTRNFSENQSGDRLYSIVSWTGVVTLIVAQIAVLKHLLGSFDLAMFFVLFIYLVAASLVCYRELFHLRPRGTSARAFFLYPLRFAPAVAVAYAFLYVFHFGVEQHNPNFSSSAKAREYLFWGKLAPVASVEQLHAFIKASPDEEKLYELAGPALRSVSLKEFYSRNEPDARGYYYFVKNVELTRENALFVAEVLPDLLMKDNFRGPKLEKELLKKWPANLPLSPYLAERVQLRERKDRSIASEKRLKVKEKILERY